MTIKKTGLNWLDALSPQERKHVITNFKATRASLNDDQRRSALETFYRVVRERRKKEPLLTSGKSDQEVALSILNSINPENLKQEAIDQAIKNGRLDIAEDLKRRRIGFDLCHISLYDEETGKELL